MAITCRADLPELKPRQTMSMFVSPQPQTLPMSPAVPGLVGQTPWLQQQVPSAFMGEPHQAVQAPLCMGASVMMGYQPIASNALPLLGILRSLDDAQSCILGQFLLTSGIRPEWCNLDAVSDDRFWHPGLDVASWEGK